MMLCRSVVTSLGDFYENFWWLRAHSHLARTMCFFLSSCANRYIDDNATHPWRHGYNVKNLCRCRQVRTGPNWCELFYRMHFKIHSCFSDFVFKIRLIRLGFSFQKQKFLYLNSQPTDSQSGILTTTPQRQLWVGDTEKPSVTFSYA